MKPFRLLQILFGIQNIFAACWLYARHFEYVHVVADVKLILPILGLFFLTPLFVLFAQLLQFAFWPQTVRGMLLLLLPTYVFLGYRAFTTPITFISSVDDLAFIATATTMSAFAVAVGMAIVIGVRKRDRKTLQAALLQLLFLIPATLGFGVWLAGTWQGEPLWWFLGQYVVIIGTNLGIELKSFLRHSILAQPSSK